MEIDTQIDGRVAQARNVIRRVGSVIANAQSQNFPYTSLPQSTRLFAAILAGQASDLAKRSAQQVGLDLLHPPEDPHAAVARFFTDSSEHLGGFTKESMAIACTAGQRALLAAAFDLIGRAERVLEGDEDLDGQPISHGPLWDK